MALHPDAFSWDGDRRGYLESKCLTDPAVFAFVLRPEEKGANWFFNQ